MRFTDPNGELFVIDDIIIAAAIGAAINVGIQGMSGNINSGGDFFLAAGIGALSGAIGSFAGQAVAGALGTATTLGGSIANGALIGASGGLAGGFVGGTGNAWMNGANFGQGLKAGLISGGISAGIGGVLGGISGGIQHLSNKAAFNRLNPEIDISTNADGSLTPSNETLNNFSDAYFPNYKYSENVSLNYDPSYTKARAITDPKPINGKYNIRFATSAFSGKYELFLTMGHEYIHVSHLVNGLNTLKYGEFAAYKWEYDVLNNFGWSEYANSQLNQAFEYYTLPKTTRETVN